MFLLCTFWWSAHALPGLLFQPTIEAGLFLFLLTFSTQTMTQVALTIWLIDSSGILRHVIEISVWKNQRSWILIHSEDYATWWVHFLRIFKMRNRFSIASQLPSSNFSSHFFPLRFPFLFFFFNTIHSYNYVAFQFQFLTEGEDRLVTKSHKFSCRFLCWSCKMLVFLGSQAFQWHWLLVAFVY